MTFVLSHQAAADVGEEDYPSLIKVNIMGMRWDETIIKVIRRGQNIALCSYRKQLEISEILKSDGPDFAQFWFKSDNFTFGWCKTVKRIQEKYFL